MSNIDRDEDRERQGNGGGPARPEIVLHAIAGVDQEVAVCVVPRRAVVIVNRLLRLEIAGAEMIHEGRDTWGWGVRLVPRAFWPNGPTTPFWVQNV